MTLGTRMATWKERENNKRRERQRRAIAAKIYAGLRMQGNYKLPKHCDNNEVLKAVCNEAGWTVEEDGTTYRKVVGCQPILDLMVMARGGGSTSASPYSSYHPSPYASSYDPSPVSSSFPSPVRTNNDDTTNTTNAGVVCDDAQDSSLFPWLNNLLPSSSSSNFPNHLFLLHAGGGGSISAPVTPPFTSTHYHCFPGAQSGPSSPTFNLVSRNPFGPLSQGGSGSRIWTHNQSGTCSPAADASVGGVEHKTSDVPMPDSIETEFAFGQVKPWKGERIHEGCIPDDLQLTLGNSTTRE